MITHVPARLAASFEHDMAQRHEVSDQDIHFSRLSGMHPVDIDILCDFTRDECLLVIIRCPKRAARHFHEKHEPKPEKVKKKSNPNTGLVTVDGKTYVSDYDLMSVWRLVSPGKYEKIVVQSNSATDPLAFSAEAKVLVTKLDWRMKSAFQHGAQDDYDSAENPNVTMASTIDGKTKERKLLDRFMVFNVGLPIYVHDGAKLKAMYDQLFGAGVWPYDANGIFQRGQPRRS